MLFELELNHWELKDGLVQVEGRKEFLENNINTLIQDITVSKYPHTQQITDAKRDKVKLEIKRLRLFDTVWMKMSQCLALLDEEFPRLKEFKANIPIDTIK